MKYVPVFLLAFVLLLVIVFLDLPAILHYIANWLHGGSVADLVLAAIGIGAGAGGVVAMAALIKDCLKE